MDSYYTAMTLLGLRDQNLPPFKYFITLEKQDTNAISLLEK
jgi:hypothetical protein